ncbi:cell wall surface anchor family protein [Rhodotorula toruloides]|uniref:Cell wall surface anchor family protein n=1 Tax=Rhodotorula toruloides TaxID=5286 RepID=A0A511KRP7_RHOTO|nr:cell wall surface anchor family protein [Rhodotorula toruloides]
MDGVEVSQEDRQSGYDISLLTLKPRNSAHIPDSLAVEAADPFGDTDERSPLAHPNPSFVDSDRPSSTRSSEQRASRTAIPPISNTVPRFAAAAYQHRARASESGSSLTKHRLDMLASAEDDDKGGWVVAGVKARRQQPLWQRRWLLLAAAILVLAVCVGVGVGVGVMMGRKKHASVDKQDAAQTSGLSFTAVPHTATPSPTSASSPSTLLDSAVTPATAAQASPTDPESMGGMASDAPPAATLAPQGTSSSAQADWVGTPLSDSWAVRGTESGWA